MVKLPDTGQSTSYSAIFGEDSDYSINTPSFTDNGNGTIKDNITKLIWQKTDGGEMTWETSHNYCNQLNIGGYNWRLPDSHELFGILDHDKNPAINYQVFTNNNAEYWWTSQTRFDDTTKVWVVNSGGGIGAHAKNETISAGGTRRIHTRCVKNVIWQQIYVDNGNGTITDKKTGLIWQKIPLSTTKNWFQALYYAENLAFAGYDDWRLPNIKELQSISEINFANPSVNPTFFPSTNSSIYWSSTTLKSPDTTKAWTVDFQFGLASYNLKNENHYIRCVRGGDISNSIYKTKTENITIEIFPNPVKNSKVNLELIIPEINVYKLKIEIYNISGQLVYYTYKSKLSDSKISILLDTENLKSGKYTIKCFINNIVINKNLIVI